MAGRGPEDLACCRYDLVVARAVADMRELSEYCLPFAKKGGLWVAAKGAECEQASPQLQTEQTPEYCGI